MVFSEDDPCPKCGGELRHYDRCTRQVRIHKGKIARVGISRKQCTKCDSIHRVIPNYILPHKHYHKSIIKGVLKGTIDDNHIFFEDYPCSLTMHRWKSQILHPVL